MGIFFPAVIAVLILEAVDDARSIGSLCPVGLHAGLCPSESGSPTSPSRSRSSSSLPSASRPIEGTGASTLDLMPSCDIQDTSHGACSSWVWPWLWVPAGSVPAVLLCLLMVVRTVLEDPAPAARVAWLRGICSAGPVQADPRVLGTPMRSSEPKWQPRCGGRDSTRWPFSYGQNVN